MIEKIKNLSKKRYEFIKLRNDSWDTKLEKYTIEEPKEIDELSDTIYKLLFNGRNELPFEFIIDELTKLGQAPCLLYDDNGHFAITGDGMQSISVDIDDQELTHFIEKDMWKDTIREALDYYLNNE